MSGIEHGPAPAADDGYLLAYEEGVRGLARQERQLDEIRSRAGILLSAAAIATSLFGGRTLDDAGPAAWLAIAAFVGLAASALVMLWPRRDWSFSASPGLIIRLYLEPRVWPLPEIHLELALHMDRAYEVNVARIDHLVWAFRAASVLLVFEVGAWVVNLATVT